MNFIVRKIFRILNDKKINEQNISNEKEDEKNANDQQTSSIPEVKTDNLFSDASPNSKTNFSKSKKKEMKRTSSLQTDPFKKATASLVKKVAKELGGDKQKISEDLLNYLKTLDVSDDSRRGKKRVSALAKNDFDLEMGDSERNFFKEKLTLGIFSQDILKARNQVKLKIWDDLEAEELAFMSKRPPKNYFEELIHWTDEGKLWHFPIDNDQGLDEEAKISFTEHIFMEQYLEPWCPHKGPLRQFMELVLIGLSKNPYLTVEEKKSHIEWFKNYFEDKKKLLQELGAVGPPKEIEVTKQK